jgi:hypothetical protein
LDVRRVNMLRRYAPSIDNANNGHLLAECKGYITRLMRSSSGPEMRCRSVPLARACSSAWRCSVRGGRKDMEALPFCHTSRSHSKH